LSNPLSDQAAFQEVDEAVRKDELKAWWKRYGTMMVSAGVVLVVAVAGVVGWQRYQASHRAEAGAAYSAALAMMGEHNAAGNAAARAELEKQAAGAPEPYRSLAALAAAQLRDTPEEQAAALIAVAPRLPAELSDLALAIAAYRAIDTGKADEVMAKLDAVSGPERPYHGSALELQALAALRKGDLKKARELWTSLAKDPASPSGAQQRAQALLDYYAAREAK
jgi:hypothetical protein